MQMYSETDVDASCLVGKRIAILGYGSQGRAHALNLKDSGHDVVMGLRPDGGSWTRAVADAKPGQLCEMGPARGWFLARAVVSGSQR